MSRVITFLPNAAAFVLLLLFRVPFLGRLIAQGVRLLQEAMAQLLNVVELLPRLVGFRPRKRLRLHCVILRADGIPVVTKDALQQQIDMARRILAEVGIVLQVAGVHEDDREAPAAALDVGCNVRAYREDLGQAGGFFEAAMNRVSFHSACRRLLGVGAPLFAVVVRSMAGCFIGCSLGVVTDYVTLDAKVLRVRPGEECSDPLLLVHELGHALGLLHRRDSGNLMWPLSGRGTALTAWQQTIIRGSRHVTFF